MAYRYATSSDDPSGWVDIDPSMGSSDRKWTQHTLDGRIYRIRCRWIDKASLWLLDLLDRQGDPLIVGIPIRVGESILLPHVGEALPGFGYGQIIARDSSGRGLDPARNELGFRVKLTYVPAVEVTE